jgi:hypothetical protein
MSGKSGCELRSLVRWSAQSFAAPCTPRLLLSIFMAFSPLLVADVFAVGGESVHERVLFVCLCVLAHLVENQEIDQP